jgi:HAE1 family hydrophobic/amphiphilic exporter-1
MAIGVSLVYLVMVAALGSLKVPFIVVLSMPLAVVGALVALVVTDRSLSLPALMGFLFLIGIVVTNAIVLLTFVSQLRNAGLGPLEAVMEAGRTRLRPILMTAFTTILALIPLAFSDSSGLVGAELATVVIGGLLSSTFLTLVAVPVVYMLFEESVPNLYSRLFQLIAGRPRRFAGFAESQQPDGDD